MKKSGIIMTFMIAVSLQLMAQKPLVVKTFGGYSTQWEVQLLNYGKDNQVMIVDLVLTLKKGKEGEYGIGRGNKGTRIIGTDGSESNQTWVQVGSKKSSENPLIFAGTATYISTNFSIDVPIKIQLRFNEIQADDFSILGFYLADNSNYGYTGGFLCEIKRSEFPK
ncbi:MAG: hypothetical protein U0W24_11975 [Bacteroidales bacterium]